jgi:hypothetical protein
MVEERRIRLAVIVKDMVAGSSKLESLVCSTATTRTLREGIRLSHGRQKKAERNAFEIDRKHHEIGKLGIRILDVDGPVKRKGQDEKHESSEEVGAYVDGLVVEPERAAQRDFDRAGSRARRPRSAEDRRRLGMPDPLDTKLTDSPSEYTRSTVATPQDHHTKAACLFSQAHPSQPRISPVASTSKHKPGTDKLVSFQQVILRRLYVPPTPSAHGGPARVPEGSGTTSLALRSII